MSCFCNKRNKTINNYYFIIIYSFQIPYISPAVRRKTPRSYILVAEIILKHLFIDPPTYLTMTLIRFFYGNGIPFEIAVQLFQVCNDRADFYLAQHFHYYYETWKNWEHATHISIYFNMHVYKHVYINGSRKKQLEVVDFLANDIPREFGKLYTLSLGRKIHSIRTCVCYY